MARVRLSISPVPCWVEPAQLLGCAEIGVEPLSERAVTLRVELEAEQAATVVARLRGLGLDGHALDVCCEPPLSRPLVRAGRLRDARDRRSTTPGFMRVGARATGEGRYSLTPEPLALALGKLAAGAHVLDACCGSGGNAIGFARAGCRVSALEVDGERLREARENARVYGVHDRISFTQGDALALIPERAADILFVDPPWGEHYDKRATRRENFPLLDALLRRDLSRYRELWLKLPSSFAIASVGASAATALYGSAPGDLHRIKFVLVRIDADGVRRLPR